ncbi:Heat stress transcription factor B-2a [Abeliophyllum distichum]|uniref:Heat stress transcription factor B-2a n=1 Tax=Abeliophyllum distichum TaxID=126358 RepID=A0ABD1SY25_9LAMI
MTYSAVAATPLATATPSKPTATQQRIVSSLDLGKEQVLSSSNFAATVCEFSGSTLELIGENERLRKENMQLNKELSNVKSLCNNIYVLMSNFTNCSSSNDQAINPLDLLPMARFCEQMEGTATAVSNGDEENEVIGENGVKSQPLGSNSIIRVVSEDTLVVFGVKIGMTSVVYID